MAKIAAVELGGTSIRVAIAEGEPTNIIDRARIPTLDPASTLAQVRDWLAARSFSALAVASFGPVELNSAAANYGFVTTTPKEGWVNADVLGHIGARSFGVPVAFDTDVNAPAMAEFREMVAEGRSPAPTSCAYITVGTGIGVGLVINGATVHGLLHPEAGHCPIPGRVGDSWRPDPSQRIPSGAEANASAPALARRAGVAQKDLAHLSDDHEVWDVCAHYLAHLCVDLTLMTSGTLSPDSQHGLRGALTRNPCAQSSASSLEAAC